MRTMIFCILGLLLAPVCAMAVSPFDGTWRPDPQLPSPSRKPDSVQLLAGFYDCRACDPPYKVKADGRDQLIPNNPVYDSMSIAVLDPHTVKGIAKKGGAQVG